MSKSKIEAVKYEFRGSNQKINGLMFVMQMKNNIVCILIFKTSDTR